MQTEHTTARRPVFTIMIGLPRSGKSSWVDRHSKGDIIVSNDWIRENILGTNYSESSNAIVWTIADATIRILLGQGQNVIFDGVNHTKGIRSYYTKIGRKYGAVIRYVYIKTSLKVCLARNKKLPNERLIDIYNKFECPTKDECDVLKIVDAKIKVC